MRKLGFILAAIALSSSAVSAAPPILGVSPTYMEFTAYEGGANPEPNILSIWRDGGNGPLWWEVIEDCNWIVVEPNSGKSMGEVDDVNVIVDISSLTGGIYNCQLTVDAGTAANSPQTVDINVVVYQPVIELSARHLNFSAFLDGVNPDEQILTISNSGTGTLNWLITEDCNWLSAEPNSGSSTGEADAVSLSVDISGLAVGIYDCNLTVSAPYAANSPQIVDVNLVIQPWAGSGTVGDPYLIYTGAQMNYIGFNPNDWDKHFKLMADIDLGEYTGTSFNIIGNASNPFTGVFDGNGHTISNFTYSSTGTNYIGLFGRVGQVPGDDTEIMNLGLIDPNINAGTGDYVGSLVGILYGSVSGCYANGVRVSGGSWVGGLVGYAGNRSLRDTWAGTISNCSSSGLVTGNECVGGITGIGRATNTHSSCNVSGTNYIGGLIGKSVYAVSNCRAEGIISGNDYVGGLIGRTYSLDYPTISVENSCASGNVTGHTLVGGLIGYQPERISNCYARGDVSGVTNVGGLCGCSASLMINCYSTGKVTGTADVGGLIGVDSGWKDGTPAFNCFWDIQTSGQASSAAGKGKTTELMKKIVTYAGYGCDELWTIDEGNNYPHLVWESKPGQLIVKPTYGGGSGTEEDPYLIYTAEQMSIIGLVLCDYDKHFKLMDNLDMSYYDGIDGRPNHNIAGTAYMEIGTGRKQPFKGVFDGNGHKISNLYLTNTGDNYVGCFGFIDGEIGSTGEGLAEVRNLGLVNPNIVDTSGRDDKGIGLLVGSLRYGRVSNCYVLGGSIYATANAQYTQDAYVGGLIGMNGYNGSITRSFSSSSVSGSGQWCYTGGLAGQNWRAAKILDSYSNSTVNGDYYNTGGLVGENYEGTIQNCYSTGPVMLGNSPGNGLVGSNGGYFHEGIIEHSFWDVQTSGCTYSDGGTGLTTAEMQDANTFTDAGWDFVGEVINGPNDFWDICEWTNYPKFVWQIPVGDFVCPDGVTMVDFSVLAYAWMSDPNDYNWDPNCDISEPNDNVIDELDVMVFTDNWLEGL